MEVSESTPVTIPQETPGYLTPGEFGAALVAMAILGAVLAALITSHRHPSDDERV